MIRRFIERLLGSRGRASAAGGRGAPVRPTARQEPLRFDGTAQGIPLEDVSSAAIRTCEGLRRAGHQAWIVGGGVRDLLLGRHPKDFDVATDATPEQVTAVFRRSRVIGRRFQIVHVMFGRDMIEVATFRALQTDAETDAHGRVLRDNVWGTQREDAERRDFTVNALYYDPIDDVLLDYTDGVADLKRRTLRMIGDPETRYREDPVRMLRVARFAAKLGFGIEEATRAPITELADLLRNVPAARLFDEMLKLLESGHALDCLHQLREFGLHHGLLPLLDVILEQPDGERFIGLALARTDARVAAGKSVSPGFLFATLLWRQVSQRWQARVERGEHSIPALNEAIDSVLDDQAGQLAIQKRIIGDMREIWMLQPRFERRTGTAPQRLLEHLRFRAAWDFLELRCEAGERPEELARWWDDYAQGDAEARAALIAAAAGGGAGEGARRKRRRRGGRGRGRDGEDDGSGNGAEAPADDGRPSAVPGATH